MLYIAPRYLYKYKSIARPVDFERAIQIIETGDIYTSPVDQLNDPMEGLGIVSMSGGYAGVSLPMSIERMPSRYSAEVKACRVISLTENPVSPQMWAYYADGYKGICLRFGNLPFEVNPVRYTYGPYRTNGLSVDSKHSGDISQARLLTKHIDWAHEQEWRAVFPYDFGSDYVYLGDGNPSAVIVGHECDENDAGRVSESCKARGIPLYETYIADWTFAVRIIPYGFRPTCTGETLAEQVRRECHKRGVPMFESWAG